VSLIYWDTMLFVYLIEYYPEHGPRTEEIRNKMQERGDSLCTSVFTVGELLTGFYKRGAHDLAAEIRESLQPPAVQLLPFDPEVAERYARIRAQHPVSAPDAIHLATASIAGANLFLTNDRKISKLTIPGIDFVAGLDVNLF
jgi:predicted nucleic acid-binding protein